jgi:ubiquinone/menaquinone biosynthesis C-methylase UbiE
MGGWSRLAGEVFLDWLAPPAGLSWIDVGCGSGAFTELIVRRCAPRETHGIDPADAQIAFARTRPNMQGAQFRKGDAMALPFDDAHFDVAVMALVIFFVPDPAKGVAEMARVVRRGGVVASYAGTSWAADFRLPLFMPSCGRSTPRRRSRRAWRPRAWTRSVRCGRRPACSR